MNIEKNWSAIRHHFNKSYASNFHVSIASVNTANEPNVTPIGSFFLNDNQAGFYFEKFPTNLPSDAKGNPNICVLAVNSNRWFWLKSLFRGKFNQPPAIKLFGQLGEKRTATKKEMRRLERRMRLTKGLKGHSYLWQDMKHIREVSFTKVQSINLGAMTKSPF